MIWDTKKHQQVLLQKKLKQKQKKAQDEWFKEQQKQHENRTDTGSIFGQSNNSGTTECHTNFNPDQLL